jgi:hypothetical protein
VRSFFAPDPIDKCDLQRRQYASLEYQPSTSVLKSAKSATSDYNPGFEAEEIF